MLIVGTGIAGSCLAYNLEKLGAEYLLCTEQGSPMRNTSSLSYGHCRLALGQKDGLVERSVSMFGADRKKMEFVFSQTDVVLETLDGLGVNFEYRSFGVIPTCRGRGGRAILRRMQRAIPENNIATDAEIDSILRCSAGFKVTAKTPGGKCEISARRLVIASGGYGGRFRHTDSFRYNSYRMFDVVTGLGGCIENVDCVFVHPFGYCNGRKILIGSESKELDFVDENGDLAFSEGLNQAIRKNEYHEMFPEIVEELRRKSASGHTIYFVDEEGNRSALTPTVHYTNGGIKTDFMGRVVGADGNVMEDAYAIGECQADGPRNGGRLPGYPFTAAIVYGKALGALMAKSTNSGANI